MHIETNNLSRGIVAGLVLVLMLWGLLLAAIVMLWGRC